MNEKQSSMLTTSLNYGAMLGVALILVSVILYITELSFENWAQWLSYIVITGGLYFFAVQYRDKELNGTISYGQALGFSVLVALFAGVISSFYSYLFVSFIDPDFVEQMLAVAEQKMIEQGGVSDDQIEMIMDQQRKMMTPGMLFLFGILGLVFMGTIISLITSIFVKKAPKPFDFETETKE